MRIRCFSAVEPGGSYYRDLLPRLVREGYRPELWISHRIYRDGRGALEDRLAGTGVAVRRVGTRALARFPGRGLTMLQYALVAAVRSLLGRRTDLNLFLTQPPLFFVWGSVLRRIRGQRYAVVVMDLYPDVAARAGLLRDGSILVRLAARLARHGLRRAEIVFVIGRCSREAISRWGVDAGRVHMVSNWVNEEEVRPVPRERNMLRRELGLEDRFVVMYSGNMGVSHDFGDILEVARRLRDRRDVAFVFAGAGARRIEIERARTEHDLRNVVVLPFQPVDRLAESLSLGDVHFVSVRAGYGGLVVPSKTYGALAAARPVIYQGAADDEIARLVRECGIGEVVEPDSPDWLYQAIVVYAASPDRVRREGERALSLARTAYSRNAALGRYCHAFRRVRAGTLIAWLGLLATGAVAAAAAQTPPQGSPAAVDGPYAGFGYSWENNQLGLERVVPAPWTPVRVDAAGAEVWGRRFELGASLLPAQIVTQRQPLFARAPALELVVDGRGVALPSTWHPVEQASDRVEWRGERRGDGLTVRGVRVLEYDGFLRLDLEIVPDGRARIDRLVLTFPFRLEAARFYSSYLEYDYVAQRLDRTSFARGYGPLDEDVAMGFNPAVWVGNHDVGLEWACETDHGWHTARDAAIRFERGSDAVVMEIGVVTDPVVVDSPYRLSFALYPTPVKPLPRDWRQIRLHPAGFSADELLDPATNRHWVEPRFQVPVAYPGLPLLHPPDAGAATRRPDVRARIREAGAGLIPYGALYAMPARLPDGEWRDYARYWRTEHPAGAVRNESWARVLGLPASEASMHYVSIAPRSFQDFVVYQYVRAIAEHGIAGMYLDIAGPNQASLNPLHPYADHVRGGGMYVPLFLQRALMKRLYVATKSRAPDFLIVQHHAKVPAIVAGFSDVVLSGEALNRVFRADHWTRRRHATDPTAYVPDYGLVPDVFYEVNYAQTRGYVNLLLPQILKWDNGDLLRRHPHLLDAWTKTLVNRAALYDIALHPSRMNIDAYREILLAHERFGWLIDVRYIGPWDSARFLGGARGGVEAALYLKPAENRLLVVLANTGEREAERVIELDRDALARAGVVLPDRLRITDAVTGSLVELHVGLGLSLPPDGLRLLIVE